MTLDPMDMAGAEYVASLASPFRMREQGRTSAQIGAELGRPASTVRKLFMRRAP